MLGPQHATLGRQGLGQEGLRIGVFALPLKGTTQAAHRFERLRIFCPERSAVQIDRLLQLLARFGVKAEIYITPPDRIPNGCLYLRLTCKFSSDLRSGSV